MEGDDGPSAVTTTPNVIKAAQEEIGRLDVLVCGQCHSVFHFVEELQEHHTKEGACPKVSHYRENNDNGQKAQIWAFLLWKDSHIQQEGLDKNSTNAWKMYQKWCKLDTHIRDSWIIAGKTIQTFTKISTTKMQETPIQVQSNESTTTTTTPDGKTVVFRKIVKNGQPEEETTSEAEKDTVKSETKTPQKSESMEVEAEKKEKPKIKPSIKPKIKLSKAGTEENSELSNDEYVIEKILAKRFNPKKKCPEYLIKWEDHSHDSNTWETAETVSACKDMVDEFERSLAKQKELKAQQANAKIVQARANVPAQKVIKIEASKPGPSTAPQVGRPMRSSKSKAMNQVKQWVGSMKDEENELTGKRRIDDSDSDSDDVITAKRAKADTGSDDDWTGESEDDRLIGRSDMIQRAFSRAHAQSNGSNRASVSSTDLATSLGLQSPEAKSSQAPVLVANAKGVVKVDPKQMPNLTSGVYLMSRKDGIIKLDSSPSGKLAVKGSPTPGTTPVLIGVQNRDNIVRKQIISTSQSNSLTPTVKVVSKVDGSSTVSQMKMIPCKPATPKTGGTQKIEPIKIQPKPDPAQVPQIHVVTAVQAPITLQPRITTGIRPAAVTPQRPGDCRPLLPRPTLRTVSTSSVLNTSTIRTPVKAPAPKQVQTPVTTRPIVQKRTTTVVSTQASPNSPSTITQKPKVTGIIASPQTVVQTVHAKQIVKSGTSPIQSQQQTKSSPKTPVTKTQSLLTPQQKLLIAKKKAQEAAGIIKASGRGFLTGARASVTRGKMKSTEGIAQAGAKTKESKLAEGDGLHMEFHEVHSEESSSEDEPDLPPVPEPDAITAPEPDSPPRPFTLCPLTGRIIGPDGEPIDQSEPEPETTTSPTTSTTSKTTTTSSESATADTTVTTSAELTLPSLDSLTESGGIMRVEMSPGGTTGTIVQTSETTTAQINLSTVTVSAPDLPCLDDTAVNAPVSTSTATTLTETPTSTAPESKTETSITTALSTITTSTVTNITATSADVKSEEKITEESKVTTADASNLVTIAEHGVVYQVAGQAEDGQTLLVARGADGEQQCVYVTTEQQGDEGSVLTLDHAVAEAVAQLIPDQVNLTPQFYVKEDGAEPNENSMVMSIMDNNANAADVTTTTQEDNETQAQVVAQVVQADEPTPGGTRRVVLLLPDGNLMMTEVDEEQYAALELDK